MSNQMDYEINKELGECYLFMGDFEKAEEYYRKAVQNNSEVSAPYMGLATVAVQRGDLDKALVLYEKANSVEENDKTLCGLGLVYMEKGNHEAAVEWFQKALAHCSDNIVALNCLVREAYHFDSVESVLPYLDKAMETSSEAESIRVSKAGCLMYLGRNSEAKDILEDVLSYNPENINAKDLYASFAA